MRWAEYGCILLALAPGKRDFTKAPKMRWSHDLVLMCSVSVNQGSIQDPGQEKGTWYQAQGQGTKSIVWLFHGLFQWLAFRRMVLDFGFGLSSWCYVPRPSCKSLLQPWRPFPWDRMCQEKPCPASQTRTYQSPECESVWLPRAADTVRWMIPRWDFWGLPGSRQGNCKGPFDRGDRVESETGAWMEGVGRGEGMLFMLLRKQEVVISQGMWVVSRRWEKLRNVCFSLLLLNEIQLHRPVLDF